MEGPAKPKIIDMNLAGRVAPIEVGLSAEERATLRHYATARTLLGQFSVKAQALASASELVAQIPAP